MATSHDPDSEFEIFVAEALRSAGYEAIPQIGAGDYFIDLGVRHPSYPHGFLAGIECDGAMYHSAKSAKDRDALRQGVLEDMGWTIYRVWSTDWFNDPRSETRKLVSFLEQLRNQKTKVANSMDELPWETEHVQSEQVSEDENHSPESHDLLEDWDDENGSFDESQDFTSNRPLDTGKSIDSSNIQLPLAPGSSNDQTAESSSHIVEENDPPLRTVSSDSLISVDRARQQLIRLREGGLQRRFRDSPRDRGLLRRSMLEALLNARPATIEEFQRDIPQSLRLNTDKQQIDGFLEDVLTIINRINPN